MVNRVRAALRLLLCAALPLLFGPELLAAHAWVVWECEWGLAAFLWSVFLFYPEDEPVEATE